jgi:hypothetical protein
MNPDTKNPAALTPTELSRVASEMDRNGNQPGEQEQTADAEDLSYDCVPSKKAITVSVRYRIRGRGQPLPYPLDEGDGQ